MTESVDALRREKPGAEQPADGDVVAAPARSQRLAVVHAGTSPQASTKLLADRLTVGVCDEFRRRGVRLEVSVIDLRRLSGDISAALISGLPGEQLDAVVPQLAEADGIIAATPIYKAEASGLFSSFFHVLERDLLIGKPVLLAATAGTVRHSLVLDHQVRALFAYMRALITPTSVFAAPEDWGGALLEQRVDRAARELRVLMQLDFGQHIDTAAGSYQKDFGSTASGDEPVDVTTDMMRLAAGGSLR